jgi:capsular exopolysaccharide synthesis family protein
MSQILKAVELAKKDGNFVQKDRMSYGVDDVGGSDLPGSSKIVTSVNLLKKNRVLSAIDDQKIIDSYGLLRTRVLRRMQQNKWKSIGVTSAGKDNGKTLTAINLGISIARKQNYNVVVVDADLRSPSIHKLLGFKPRVGLSDYLTSDIPIDNVLVHPSIERLVVLPGGKGTDATSELLSSSKMSRLSQELKTRYPSQIVIYDLPPVLVGDDVVAFAPNFDTALLIVEEGGTETDKLKRSIDLLEGVDIIGTVLNKSTGDTLTEEYYY